MIRRDIAPESVVPHALELEAHVDELWVVEDLPFAGGISQMTAVLGATTDVVVGHGIAPAPFRTASGLAMEWATLARMYPGRVACGLGHGVQSWMSQLSLAVESPLTLLGETCDVVRALLRGESVSTSGRYVSIDDVVLEFPPDVVPFVSLGVVGPRSLELSGERADGTVLCEAHGPAEIDAARDRIRVGQARAGRTGDAHRITVFAAFHLGDEADIVRNPAAPVGWEAVSQDVDVVTEALQTLFDAGADSVVLVPLGPEPRHSLEQATNDIIPALRSHLVP